MSTTLRLEDDVYQAARSLARSEGKTLGEIVSRLARQARAAQAVPEKGPIPGLPGREESLPDYARGGRASARRA